MCSKGYGSWFVCLSVCPRLFWHYRPQDDLWAIPVASEQQDLEKAIFLKRLRSGDMA